jgi:tetratricopeptide (TPR) repeat protein
MSRWLLLLALGIAPLQAQNNPGTEEPRQELKRQHPTPATSNDEAIPPEEDETIAPQHYDFNPVQAKREIKVGNYYFRRSNFRAAATRFREATRWNEGEAQAWLRLGEASEKLKDPDTARQAYTKYLAIVPTAKDAAEIRARIERLK